MVRSAAAPLAVSLSNGAVILADGFDHALKGLPFVVGFVRRGDLCDQVFKVVECVRPIFEENRQRQIGGIFQRPDPRIERERVKRVVSGIRLSRQSNLSLGCVETAKVEAPAVVSMMRDGGLRPSFAAFAEAP